MSVEMAQQNPPYAMGAIFDDPNHPAAQRPVWFGAANQVALPALMDLRGEMPAVYDQGPIGSCTANAVAGLVAHARALYHLPAFTPSRLFNYYYSRARFGGEHVDGGSSNAFALASTVYEGICSEDAPAGPGRWLYDIAAVNTQPDAPAMFAAKHHQNLWYWQVLSDSLSIMRAVAQHHPVCFAFTAYRDIYYLTPENPILPLPQPGEVPVGGHAVDIVGYDSPRQLWLCRNSWGQAWGAAGHFWMPWAYPIQDLWVIAREA